MGAWSCANTASVEDTARTLRKAKLRFLSRSDRSAFRREFAREFLDAFGDTGRDVRVFSAPGRVNLIGEHTDYNGGLVLPAALELSLFLALRPRADGKVVIRDLNVPGEESFSLDDGMDTREKTSWVNYPKGVLSELLKMAPGPGRGFDALIFSEIPSGSGLSSSAALEVAFALGWSRMSGLEIPLRDLALLCQRAENLFVGVQCGIMDQFSSAFGRRDCAVLLDCDTLELQYVPLHLGDYRIVIGNTNKKRSLSESRYNERRAECEKGLADLRKKMDLRSLGELDIGTFQKNMGLISDPVVRKRVRHVVTENERVRLAAQALQDRDLEEFGKLMIRSHESLRDDYEVTGPALDALFEAARSFDGCLGTRMTGAGFGGCTVSLVHKNRVEDFQRAVGREYGARTRLAATFTVSGTGDGAGEILS